MNANNNRQMMMTIVEFEIWGAKQTTNENSKSFEQTYEPKTALNESFTNGSASPP